MRIVSVSARVMRSFDYSQFEIRLDAEVQEGEDAEDAANHLASRCLALADQSVKRYCASKEHRELLDRSKWDRDRALERLHRLIEMRRDGQEISPEGAVILRAYDTEPGYELKLKGLPFNYNDWDEENPWRPAQKVKVDSAPPGHPIGDH